MATTNDLCPETTLSDLMMALQAEPDRALERVEASLRDYPGDGRLNFLHGSMLATARRYAEAHAAMTRAVTLAPYFWIARFQLGLLELTSGDPESAVNTWQPLHELPKEHALATFATGLEAMIRDDIAVAIGTLELGITQNTENLPLNRDMRMMIERLSVLTLEASPTEGDAQPTSAAQMLLRQYGDKGTKH